MNFQIQMPHVGESVTEAVIGKWLKSPGDRVEKFDPIVEVITDKVTMEVPAPADGTLTKIIADEGETVTMGAVIAEMDAEGAVAAGSERSHAAPAVEPPAQPVSVSAPAPRRDASSPRSLRVAAADRVGSMITGANVGPTGGAFSDSSLQKPASAAPAQTAATSEDEATNGRRLSPVVLRLCEMHGIDPSTLTGTGLGGRVTRQDVMRVVESGGAAGPAPEPEAVAAVTEDRTVRPSAVRSMIAVHMARSFNEIPHAWSAVEVDVTGLVACRAAHKDAALRDHGVSLTYLPFGLHEVARALRANPLLNSSWKEGQVVLKGEVNTGIAVAGKDGLVVPVVRHADMKGLIALTRELNGLVERARNGKLSVEDVQGGTFTLNNTGALGSVWGGAIINHPQAAILTTEAIVKRPVVLSGPGGDAIAVRSMMNICLSFDHRIVDGAEASAFLQDVKRRLEAITADTALE
jgi:2-oxoisovalerate dehydrogenase E2 component (dihydrolipoyl transacylase)